ncbi:GGDEF domain-containing protein [Pseudomonas fluorescens]|uniref:diguanylate cyclase n=1 Tax=Pseudomonas fluorescens TaxID=294 RepID=A0A944HCP5_PSEFL|nr:GGDEF domain-containing protein [Pseudomonas fluorescens]MBT2295091.1 diguanylate cyclase [Pseudomonas fluorescens]MBT2309319.1 diguanylate cyclase [Pseudomonas fluorescens]MBT2313787.1 diguanylate cyclase [Pseudomonas fluorescens]MBT2318503.1 diguanylate cyclase [Pseudomonas fluorescens]MBT2329426.1 diguanylate cyclase [Pseudomonas fluorescens]
MSDEAERWREKYFKNIEQQEKLERRWAARLDLLRRGLVRSTLAAEGSDRAVDQCMKEMREVVRTDDMDAALAALLPRLEKAVLDSEQRRETRVEQVSAALTSLVAQLQALPLPKEVSRPLKKFSKQLEDRVDQAREIPLLLSELSSLQGQALSALEAPTEPNRPGLLQRLFGGHGQQEAAPQPHEPAQRSAVPVLETAPPTPAQLATETVPVIIPAPAPAPALVAGHPATVDDAPEPVAFIPPMFDPDPEPSSSSPVSEAGEPTLEQDEAPEQDETTESAPIPVENAVQVPALENPDELMPEQPSQALDESLPLPPEPVEPSAVVEPAASDLDDDHYELPDSPEPSYSSVARHIEDTLLGLLGDLTLPERHRPQAEAMRERLQNGLNWYELLPILDDLAVLMLAITDTGQHEFEAYLQRLNDRLESFQSSLRAASADHADNQSASREMDTQIREQVDGLQSSVQEADDLEGLKQVLENHLEGLLGTMDQHQKQRDQREQEVSARLKSLAERVALMEQDAQVVRDNLEEQRQKALIDPLTGLPNRAAWSERLEQEVAQWQRHGNSLLLAMLDLDHFKRINDNYGHLAGDRVLKIIASVLRRRLRGSDFIARFGGEEFVLLVPDTPLASGARLAETLRAAIEACPFHFKGEPVTITVSVGMTAFKSGEHSDSVLKRADQALYRAKNAGRNRIELG